MAVLTKLACQHKKPWIQVNLYGGHPQMADREQVLLDSIDTAVSMGAHRNKVCVLVPAAGSTSDHFQRLLPAANTPRLKDRLWADAAWTTDPGIAIVVPTADCQTVVIKNLITGMMLVAHGGKPAMTPGHLDKDARWNIVDLCISKASEHSDPSNLMVYVSGAISGTNYWHEDPEARPSMEPFHNLYGNEVFVDNPDHGRLDLFSVTRMVARRWRIPESNIVSDGLCTYKHSTLASFRCSTKSDKERNITIAVNRKVPR